MPYSIEFQEDAWLLVATLSGFWEPRTIADFASDIAAARASILDRHPSYHTLFDASEFTVQSPEVVDGFQRMQLAARGLNQGRIALVLESALARLQARRAVIDDRIAVFESRREALAWLAEAPVHA